MNLERRSLLKGMALGGLAGIAMGGSGLALARGVAGSAAAQPTLVLISPAVAGSAFLQGGPSCCAAMPAWLSSVNCNSAWRPDGRSASSACWTTPAPRWWWTWRAAPAPACSGSVSTAPMRAPRGTG